MYCTQRYDFRYDVNINNVDVLRKTSSVYDGCNFMYCVERHQ